MHILYFVVWILRTIFLPVLAGYYVLLSAQAIGAAFGFGFGAVTIPGQFVIAVTYLLIAAFIALVVIMLVKINLTGIKVPILTYPDCELCKCSPDSNTSENIGEGTGAPSTNTQGNKRIPCETIKSNTEITSVSLIPGILQLFTQGVFQIPTVSPTNPNGFSSQRAQIYIRNLTGLVYDEQYASNNIGAPTFVYDDDPGSQDGNTSPDRWIYTTSLPMADRINLFNVKAKYFNGTSITPVSNNSNPGGGVNIVEVNFQPTQTAIYHYDNTMVIICDKDSLQKLSAGQLISFQNPTISGDINTTGGITNVYGNNAITGVTSTGAQNITIQYANPDGVSGNITKTYPSVNITADTTNNYHKFPTDVEYFQVITGMTYSQFSGQCNSDIFDSLNDRYISNDMIMGQSSYEGDYKRSKNINFTPIELIEDYKNICILILNRGVDPYTPKVPISYGLGRLFGRVNFNDVKVFGNYHMNIPIQGKFKNVSHLKSDLSNSNLGTDVYSGQKLYFNSFSYKPQISTTYGSVSAYTLGQLVVNPNGVISSGYSSFTSNLVSYYSNMDNRSLNLQPQCGGDVNNVIPMDTRVVNADTSYGLKVSNQNKFSMMVYPKEYQFYIYPPDYVNFITPSNPYSVKTGNNQGYFPNEIIEGGPVMYTNIINGAGENGENYKGDAPMTGPYYKVTSAPYSITSNYYSSIYNTTGNTLTFSSGSNGNQIIMRGDRLPTSTNVDEYCCNGLVLQKNSKFEMYVIPEDGVLNVSSSESSTGSASSGDLQYTIQDLSGSKGITKVFDSFTCNGSVNLKCYSCKSDGPNGTISVLQDGCQKYLGETIFEYGCYKFITTIFLSLGNDLILMFEWIARNMVMLGACRNVFSHRFVNNWVNGVLYAFPIKNEIVEYTSPLSDRPNQPIFDYCKKAIMIHSRTNNLYYRAAKYDVVSNEFRVVDGNIGFPTTIMDLGPRTDYLQELVMSDEYDGYVVNKLESSSFGTVDDILNLFIVSRFINSDFLTRLLGSVNIIGYFSNGRTGTNFQIDADYAQLISINSELGVAPFLPGNYPDSLPGQQNPIFFDCNNVLGIFFSSDTQIRDYITPKRTIINPTGTTLGRCTFNNFPVYSQKVPLSQWKINGEYIFGKQFDDWEYGVSGNNIFSHKYQSLDRLDAGSRYFRSKNQSQTNYQKGYIYAVNSGGTISANVSDWNKNTISPQLVTVGAPFHFYFGLRRGASSFDRFRTKWINTNNVVN